MNLNKTENTAILGIFLAFTGLIAALLLAICAKQTAAPIARAAALEANKSLISVMPPFKTQKSTVFNNIRFTAVFDAQGKLAGIAGETSVKGYGGEIKTLAGMNPDGSIRTVIILENNETPGLGSNVCERKFRKTVFNFYKPLPPGLPPNPILDQFTNLSASPDLEWKVKRDGGTFDFVTGATITSRAILEAVAEGAKTFALKKEEFKKEAAL